MEDSLQKALSPSLLTAVSTNCLHITTGLAVIKAKRLQIVIIWDIYHFEYSTLSHHLYTLVLSSIGTTLHVGII